MNELIDATSGRTFLPVEMRLLRGEAVRMKAAYTATRELEKYESAIVDEVLTVLKNRHAGAIPWQDRMLADGALDLTLALRSIAQATLADEPRWLDDKLLDYLRTVLSTLGLEPAMVTDCYQELNRACEQSLPPEAWSILKPYVRRLERSVAQESDWLKQQDAARRLRQAAPQIIAQVLAEQKAQQADFESIRPGHGESLRVELEILAAALAAAVELDDWTVLERRAVEPLIAAWDEELVLETLEDFPDQWSEAVRENMPTTAREIVEPWSRRLSSELREKASVVLA